MDYDIIIKNGNLIDGTGDPAFLSSIGIKDGKIAEKNVNMKVSAKRVIEATDKVVCPGFINIHSHADSIPFVDLKIMSNIRQGITTLVVENCGDV